jgi:hypothetical protein
MVEDDETNERMYFRFYDPEVMRVFLRTCTPRQRAELFDEIGAVLLEDEHGRIGRHGAGQPGGR